MSKEREREERSLGGAPIDGRRGVINFVMLRVLFFFLALSSALHPLFFSSFSTHQTCSVEHKKWLTVSYVRMLFEL